jgi:hypothetical protein
LEIRTTAGLTEMPGLLPVIRTLDADLVFETQMKVMLDGLEALARRAKVKRGPADKPKTAPAARRGK